MVAGKAVTPGEHADAARLHDYWVAGPGLARWAESPHPWTTLRSLLAQYIHDPKVLDATTSKQHTGSDAYRLEHGGKIRGQRVGPG